MRPGKRRILRHGSEPVNRRRAVRLGSRTRDVVFTGRPLAIRF